MTLLNTNKIKERMAERGITQKDISEALGLSQSTMSQKINRKRPLYLHEAEHLAAILDIPDERFGDYFFTRQIA